MPKTLTPSENSKKQSDNTKNATKLDYTTIADRLKTASWSNDTHTTGVVKPVNWIPTLPLIAKAVK